MRVRLLGTFFLTLGLLVGTVAAVALIVGFEPSRLPAALLDLAAYKLTFLAAFGLIAAGAVLARHARRGETSVYAPPALDRAARPGAGAEIATAATAPALGTAIPASGTRTGTPRPAVPAPAERR
jgi:hypothetical protein